MEGGSRSVRDGTKKAQLASIRERARARVCVYDGGDVATPVDLGGGDIGQSIL